MSAITLRELMDQSAEALAEEVYKGYLEGEGGRYVEERIIGATHVLYVFFKHLGGKSSFESVRRHLDDRVSRNFDKLIEAKDIVDIYIHRLQNS